MSASGDDTVFQPLFDGSSVEGWKMCGPGRFEFDAREGVIRSVGGMGLFWYAPRMFRDFVLQVEWRERRREDNSGVFIRFPDPGQDPWIAVREGYEIQIYDNWDDPLFVTGAVYELSPARRVASREVGEWNLFEIIAEGHLISVRLNGEIVVDRYRGDRRLEGHIGIQNHDDESCVAFRSISIKEI
jgi:3-keto-disaccharide hydrolase